MTVHLRSALDSVASYVPGRTEAQVAAAYGLDRVVKLSSNESAHGPLPGVLEQAAAQTAHTHRYPDTVSLALRVKLGEIHGLDPEILTVGSGSVSLLQQLVTSTAGPGDEVVFSWRSFEAYPVFPALAGATAVRVPNDAQGRHDLEAMAAAVTERTTLVLLCTPNNPTGTALTATAVEAFLDRVPTDVTVVIDEAYREYATNADQVDGLAMMQTHPNVAVLRTFSKAYGLAALRVGWCAAPPELAVALRQSAVPFAVGALAQQAAIISLDHGDIVRSRAAEVIAERARVTKELDVMGVATTESQGNFVWLPVGGRTAAIAAALEQRGVIVRAYGVDGIRVTVGLPEENDAFLAALAGALTAP